MSYKTYSFLVVYSCGVGLYLSPTLCLIMPAGIGLFSVCKQYLSFQETDLRTSKVRKAAPNEHVSVCTFLKMSFAF